MTLDASNDGEPLKNILPAATYHLQTECGLVITHNTANIFYIPLVRVVRMEWRSYAGPVKKVKFLNLNLNLMKIITTSTSVI